MLCFENHNEILALFKMLIEAKFDSEPNNRDIAGSPLAAEICEKTVEALIKADKSENAEKKWREWLTIKEHTFYTEERIRLRREQLKDEGCRELVISSIITREMKDRNNQSIWEIALKNAKRDYRWHDPDYSDHSKQVELAHIYLSPFTCSDSEIDEFIVLCLEKGEKL